MDKLSVSKVGGSCRARRGGPFRFWGKNGKGRPVEYRSGPYFDLRSLPRTTTRKSSLRDYFFFLAVFLFFLRLVPFFLAFFLLVFFFAAFLAVFFLVAFFFFLFLATVNPP